MSWISNHRPLGFGFSLFALSVSLLLHAPQAASAQRLTHASNPVVEDLRREVSELRNEIHRMQRRDAERLAPPNMRFASRVEAAASESSRLSTNDCTQAPISDGGCGHDCKCNCGCYPCQCPLPDAPCFDCPRVSTLNPYFNVNIFGAFVGDMLFNEARPVSPGAPYYLTPASATGLDQNTVDIHARSSYLGAAVTGPQMGNFQAGGMAMGFFYNDNVTADQYGILPVQVFGDLKNEDWRFAAGLQFDVFNPSSPTMLTFGVLCGSGNAGNAWRGQFRVERFIHPDANSQWTIQAALSEPIASVITPDFRLIGEDNGWPNVELRTALGLGPIETVGSEAKRPFEIGLSGVVGQLRTTPIAANRVVTDVWGAGIDFRWNMSDALGFSGELYTGKALGTYNGGILQNVNVATFEGIRTSGGWGEVFVYWTPCLHSHFGYGIDDPHNNDLSANPADFQRERNETVFANLIWDLNSALRIGFEATYRQTRNTSTLDNHGMGYQTQVRCAF